MLVYGVYSNSHAKEDRHVREGAIRAGERRRDAGALSSDEPSLTCLSSLACELE